MEMHAIQSKQASMRVVAERQPFFITLGGPSGP